MELCTCSIGYTVCKHLGLSPTYDQWSFSHVKRFLRSPIVPHAKICAPITQLKAISASVKQPNKKIHATISLEDILQNSVYKINNKQQIINSKSQIEFFLNALILLFKFIHSFILFIRLNRFNLQFVIFAIYNIASVNKKSIF